MEKHTLYREFGAVHGFKTGGLAMYPAELEVYILR